MTLFGINFAIGVATVVLSWNSSSARTGAIIPGLSAIIFGAPLAIEGILAFFMEATFVAVMFFGWNKVSPRSFHLASTWLTAIGASLVALDSGSPMPGCNIRSAWSSTRHRCAT